ncbi:MAG: hypothetical protein OXH04_21705 [Acidobacteria bacterium]|nr:hypothetical protein [Acidobacteriota bacterium]
MSLLGRLAVGWHPERAATIALAHILDVKDSPGMASAFVDMVGRTGPLEFEPGRVKVDLDQKDHSRPDVTVHDKARRQRVFIETVFWEGVPEGQPGNYLKELPEDIPSALVYLAPRKRIHFLREDLRRRSGDSFVIGSEEEAPGEEAVWMRVGSRVLLIASWAYALDELRRVADIPVVEQDIAQLQGFTKRMETAAFLPLAEAEAEAEAGAGAGDRALARRLLDYRKLVVRIAQRLEKAEGLVRNLKYSRPSYRMRRDQGCDMLVHGTFQMRFGIELGAWRDSGITPLWWVLRTSDSFSTLGHWARIKRRIDGVRSYSDALYIPVRLRTGVDEKGVVDDAVRRMRGIADELREVSQNRPTSRTAPVKRGSLLKKVVHGIRRPPEPSATLALLSVLNASPEIARRFLELLGSGGFEIGRVGSEWEIAKGVKPDLSIHDTGETLRILVENKFEAGLQPSQPVGYLGVLPPHPESKLAFIVPEWRLDGRWDELKDRCVSKGFVPEDESPPGDPRRARVLNRTMLITSWKRVLDALQRAASEGGHSAIEQDIAQLRGLAEG